MSPFVTLFLNAATESQIFAGMIDGIKLVRTHQTKHLQPAGVIDMFDIRQLIRHSRLDVTFCDCRLRGAGSIVRDSTFNYY